VLAAEERTSTKLQDRNFLWKLFKIDDHIGVAISGLSSDARLLVDQARIFAQSNKLTYDEPVDVEILSKRVGDIMQVYTQHAGVRPFGVSMLLGGVDKAGSKLFQTDPSGACWSYKAFAVGTGGETVREILEQEYHNDMTLKEAISLAIKCLSKVIEGKLDSEKVRVAIIPVETNTFTWISGEELVNYLEKVIE